MIQAKLLKALQLASLGALLLLPSSARAAECMLGPVALPWLSGPPEWEDFDSDGEWRSEFHDPRWSGAPLDFLTYVPGSTSPTVVTDSAIRTIIVGDVLYVSFQAETDSNGPDGNDYAFLAFSNGSANDAYAIRIAADTSGASIPARSDPDGTGPVVVPKDNPLPHQLATVGYWHTTDSTAATPNWGTEQSSPPSSWTLPATALKGAVWDRSTAKSPRWGITIKLDLSALALSGNTRFFFGTRVSTNASAPATDIILANAPPKSDTDTDKIADTIIPNKKTGWVDYLLPGTACTSGITLDRNDVGVWTGALNSTSSGSLSNQICTDSTCTNTGGVNNIFSVTARNVDNTNGIGTWAVRMRLRVAAWGSEVAYRNEALWKDIHNTPLATPIKGTDVFTTSAANLVDANGWHWFSPVASGSVSSVTMHYQCKKDTDAYCPHLADESEGHQCVLAELGQPASATPFKFKNTAVFKNMDYLGLSAKKIPATISLAGLKTVLGAAEAKDRDVYLYVETRNLPAHGDEPMWLPMEDMAKAQRLAEHPVSLPTLPGRPPGQKLAVAPQKPAPVAPAAPPKPAPNAVPNADRTEKVPPELALAKRLTDSTDKLAGGLPISNTLSMTADQVLDSVWPTYRVHAYYDSGLTSTVRSKKDHVLIPMVPFGFRMQHDGSLYGFTNALAAMPGVELTDLGNSWYKLRIKAEGMAKVTTSLTAEEKPKTPPAPGGTGCPTCPVCPPPAPHGHCNCRFVQSSGGDYELGAGILFALSVFLRRRKGSRRSS